MRPRLRYLLIAAALALLAATGVLVWHAGALPEPGSTTLETTTTSTTRRPTPPTTVPYRASGLEAGGAADEQSHLGQVTGPTRITIAAVGDIMVHDPQIPAALDPATGLYDFFPSFAPIAPYLKGADYAIGNFETRTAGAARGYSGFPAFNSPDAIAKAVKDSGIDLVGTANNHSLDMDYDGLATTLDVLDGFNLSHVGTYRSAAEQKKPFIATIQGVKVAFLNYTQDTNGSSRPTDKPWSLNLLGDGSACIAEAKAAREQGADLVVAFLHWGREYERAPDSSQRTTGTRLLQNGVDVIIGAHPHVVQPIERLTVDRGGKPFEAYVAYSLGNFLSNQREQYQDSGIILYLDIEKGADGTRVTGVRYLPTYVEKQPVGDGNQWRVLPVHPDVQPVTDVPLNAESLARMTGVWQELTSLLGNPASHVTAFSAADVAAVTEPPPRP